MPLVPFSPPPGLNSDDTTLSSTPAWVDGDNVRFRLGKPQTIGGSAATGAAALAGGVVDMLEMSVSGTTYYAFGTTTTATSLYVGAMGAEVDVTPAALPACSRGWSFAMFGAVLLAAPRGPTFGGTIWQHTVGSGADATEVTQAPNRIDAGIIVTPERQVLAFGCNEESSGTFNPLCIRGSDIEDYTDWTTTASNNAFEHILDGVGAIIAARQVGIYIAVWTTDSLWLGQFVGDPSQTYRFDKIANCARPIAQRAITVLNGTVYWFGDDFQMRAWTPGSQVGTVPCPIRQGVVDTATNPSLQEFDFAISHVTANEIWFFYQRSSTTTYIAYSVDESAMAQRPVWFKGDLLAPISKVGPVAAICGGKSHATKNTSFYGVSSDGLSCYLDMGLSEGGPANAYIKSGDFYFDETQRRMMVKGIRPDITSLNSTATVLLTLYFRDYPQQQTPVTKGPFTLTSATAQASSRKKDFRGSGKIVSVKWQSPASTLAWRLGKSLFEVVLTGER